MGVEKTCLNEAVLLCTHNIWLVYNWGSFYLTNIFIYLFIC